MHAFLPDRKRDCYLLVSFLFLAVSLILFVFRAADDNRLTSWSWVFVNADAVRFFSVLLLSILTASLLSLLPLPEKNFRAIVLFLLSFLAASCFWREPEVIIDAARYFTQAKQLARSGTGHFFSGWGRDIFAWTDLPLVPFCYGLLFKYLGENRLIIQVFTSLLFSGTVLITYLWGATLWDEETGFNGGLLLLGFPYLYTQIPLMLVDVPTMFFLLLALFVFTRAVRAGGGFRQVFAAVALCCAFYAKFSNWLFLTGVPVILLVSLKPEPRPVLRRAGAVFALSLFLIIGLLLVFKFEIIIEQIRLLQQYQKPGLGRWGEGYISTFLFQTHPFIAAAAAYSLFRAWKKKEMALVGVCFFVALIFVLHIKRIRYSLPVFPMLALMASYGIGAIGIKEIRRLIVYGIVCSSLALALLAYLPFLRTMSAANIATAADFLESRSEVDRIEVVTLPLPEPVVNPAVTVSIIDLFSSKEITWEPDPGCSPPEGYKESPLRFTWEYSRPEYYAPDQNRLPGNSAILTVFDCQEQPRPPLLPSKRLAGYNSSKSFHSSTSIFQYQTCITVYYK